MKAIKNILLLVSGLLAIIPGFVILKTSLSVPSQNLENLFFGVIEAAGCLSIILLYINKDKIIAKTKKSTSKYSLILFGGFLLGLCCYILLFNCCVISSPSSNCFIPLFWTDELAFEITQAGGKYEFVEKWMTDGSRRIVEQTASLNLTMTILLFLFIYIFTLVSLISAFVITALNIQDEEFSSN